MMHRQNKASNRQNEMGAKVREQMENAQIGYQLAVQMAIGEGQSLWSGFNAGLVANGIILAAVAVSLNVAFKGSSVISKIIPGTLSSIGLVICLLWIFSLKRRVKVYDHWKSCALHFETKYLYKTIKMH